eukprot:GHVU01130621.1.p1 GENE.GHVU01130621.1~~GHVU01130621.1.p1  ORF type:complete len:173 (-),score=4.69 GHVU01130621.1:128-646(-)
MPHHLRLCAGFHGESGELATPAVGRIPATESAWGDMTKRLRHPFLIPKVEEVRLLFEAHPDALNALTGKDPRVVRHKCWQDIAAIANSRVLRGVGDIPGITGEGVFVVLGRVSGGAGVSQKNAHGGKWCPGVQAPNTRYRVGTLSDKKYTRFIDWKGTVEDGAQPRVVMGHY